MFQILTYDVESGQGLGISMTRNQNRHSRDKDELEVVIVVFRIVVRDSPDKLIEDDLKGVR